jgi:hypothetical protein
MTQLDQAWESFLASLAAAKDVVTGPLGGRDDRELAEGLRHVTRLTSVALEMIVEKGGPGPSRDHAVDVAVAQADGRQPRHDL